MKELFLDALRCRNRRRVPVWLMRQAGRYLPEYRRLREKYDFLTLCHQPDLAAEVTLMPIKKFGMDAAILFSDILVIPEAMGVGLHFSEGKGPVIQRPLNTERDVVNLPKINIKDSLSYVGDTIRNVLPELGVPLIGFCGGPFTVASYLIEGGGSHDLKKTKQWMLRNPESFHHLLEQITRWTIDYLKLQINAGVHAIQIFDSWANVLGYVHFKEFSLAYLKKILLELEGAIPVILFCRGSSVFALDLSEIQPDGISLDWNVDLTKMREVMPNNIALQGNLDPDILYAYPDYIKKAVVGLLRGMKGDPGYIFNLGHGIKPDVSVDAVKTLVEAIKNFDE